VNGDALLWRPCWSKINTIGVDILKALHIFTTPGYKKKVFGNLSVAHELLDGLGWCTVDMNILAPKLGALKLNPQKNIAIFSKTAVRTL
jgi:hypothetical protein